MSNYFDPAREAEEIGLPPGHTLRPATWDDVPAVAQLREAANRPMDPTLHTTEERVRYEWRNIPAFSPENDTRLVFDGDGALVAYFEYYRDIYGNHPSLMGVTHPDACGRGLGTAGLRWGVGRAMEEAASLPSGQRVSAFASTLNSFAPAVALLEGFGMKPLRYFRRMVIDLDRRAIPAPDWPEGVELRPFEPERDALAVYRASDEAFQDHWLYEPVTSEEEGFEAWRHRVIGDSIFDPTLLFVAWAGDAIAALALCRSPDENDPAMGWISDVAVRRPWRKRGLATALLHHSFAELQRRGQARAGLAVDSKNLTGATRLYERVGMHILREWVTYELELRPGYETAAM